MVKKILISGSNGFVGSNLIRYLLCNHIGDFRIFSLTRSKEVNTLYSLSWSELDEVEKLDISTFIHLAGIAHDLGGDNFGKDEYFEVNTNLSVNLFRSFLRSTATQFIFLSSVKAVADVVDGILTEDSEENPMTPYGQSKLIAEKIMQRELENWQISNLEFKKKLIILRPCMIHGPGNKGNLNLLFQLVSKNLFWPLASFQNQRSYLSIDNLCFVIHEFLTRDLHHGIYNVADDRPLSTNELIKLISLATQKRIFFLRIPKSFVIFMSEIGDKFNLPLNSSRIEKLTGNYIVSNQKLSVTLGSSLPLENSRGMLITIKSFMK